MSTPAGLEQNIDAYEAMRETLETHHLHKFVVFHNAEFIESFDSFHHAAREAVRRFGQGPYLIRQFGPRGASPCLPRSHSAPFIPLADTEGRRRQKAS